MLYYVKRFALQEGEDMFTKDMHISLLLDFYGDILPQRRYEMTSLYYNDDLSLAEIAEICGISRQGVRDAVKKSESELRELEEKLGLCARFTVLKSQLKDISGEIRALPSDEMSPKLRERLKAVADSLETLNI